MPRNRCEWASMPPPAAVVSGAAWAATSSSGDLLGHDVDVAARLEGQAPAGGVCVSEELLVRKVIGDLATDVPGVGLLAPLGFGGRQVAARIVERMRAADPRQLVVRLVPDPQSNAEARIYGALIRDLRRGLERELGKPLPAEWSAPFPDPQRPASEEAEPDRARKARSLGLVDQPPDGMPWPARSWKGWPTATSGVGTDRRRTGSGGWASSRRMMGRPGGGRRRC